MICGLISFVLNNVTGSLAGIQSFSCDWTYIGIMFNSKYMQHVNVVVCWSVCNFYVLHVLLKHLTKMDWIHTGDIIS